MFWRDKMHIFMNYYQKIRLQFFGSGVTMLAESRHLVMSGKVDIYSAS
jgi:hypothetical protein